MGAGTLYATAQDRGIADSDASTFFKFRRILRKEYRRAVGTHYGQTRIRQAEFSLCHQRDGRAGTTILQLVFASGDRTNALPSDYWPAGLLEQGQRRRIRRSRRTVLRNYGPEEAASSCRRAVGTTGPFQGPLADREQRTPPSIPPGGGFVHVETSSKRNKKGNAYIGSNGCNDYSCASCPSTHRIVSQLNIGIRFRSRLIRHPALHGQPRHCEWLSA
jgi:hypothetical protein